jgi:hypothetical protein
VRGLRRSFETAWSSWKNFWFYAEPGESLEWFRRALGAILFFFYLSRTPDLALFYSDQGIAPISVVPTIMQGNEYRYTLFSWFTGIHAVWVCHWLFLGALAGLVLGFLPRLSAFIAMVMHLSFVHRNMAVAYGVDVITSYYMFYLFLAGGKRLTIAAAVNSVSQGVVQTKVTPSVLDSFLTKLQSVAFRFCQIQVCLIYAYSGLEKIRGPQWWNGEALWYVLTNFQYATWDFTWLSAFPALTTALTFLTVLWETYFPVLILVPFLRPFVLMGGVFLHVGIAITLNIPYFSGLMICTYLIFLKSQELVWLSTLFQGWPNALFKSLKLKTKVAGRNADESIV